MYPVEVHPQRLCVCHNQHIHQKTSCLSHIIKGPAVTRNDLQTISHSCYYYLSSQAQIYKKTKLQQPQFSLFIQTAIVYTANSSARTLAAQRKKQQQQQSDLQKSVPSAHRE